MGSLNKFLGKSKEIELDGEKIMIHPLKVKDMHLFSRENVTQEENAFRFYLQIFIIISCPCFSD